MRAHRARCVGHDCQRLYDQIAHALGRKTASTPIGVEASHFIESPTQRRPLLALPARTIFRDFYDDAVAAEFGANSVRELKVA
jgi:hypothetical protein